jgi:hypothetical protein
VADIILAADANGVIVRALLGDVTDAAMRATAHPNAVGAPLVFDSESNAATVADLRVSTGPYRLLAGVLTKNGAPVTLAADSPETTFRRQLATLLQDQRDYPGLATPTAAQTVATTRSQARLLLLLAKLAQRNGWL